MVPPRLAGTTGEYQLANAIAPHPLGPYTLVSEKVELPHEHVGDFTLLTEPAGNFLMYNQLGNATGILFVAALNEEVTALASPLRAAGPLFNLTYVESPILFRRNGSIYALTGKGCCYCAEGSGAFVFRASQPLGPWEALGNIMCDYSRPPLGGHASRFSYGCAVEGEAQVPHLSTTRAQLSDAFAVHTAHGEEWILELDAWQQAPDRLKGHDPQLWLPLRFDEAGRIRALRRIDRFTLDAIPYPGGIAEPASPR